MNLQSKTRYESKFLPGVAYTVRRLTEGRRIALSLSLADVLDKLDRLRSEAADVARRVAPLIVEARRAIAAGDVAAIDRVTSNSDVLEAARLQRKIETIDGDEILPRYVQALLVNIEGLDVDELPITTAEGLIAEAPSELYREVAEAVRRELGLSDVETKNSESPITSTALADGRVKNTSAEPAEGVEITAPVAAVVTIPTI